MRRLFQLRDGRNHVPVTIRSQILGGRNYHRDRNHLRVERMEEWISSTLSLEVPDSLPKFYDVLPVDSSRANPLTKRKFYKYVDKYLVKIASKALIINDPALSYTYIKIGLLRMYPFEYGYYSEHADTQSSFGDYREWILDKYVTLFDFCYKMENYGILIENFRIILKIAVNILRELEKSLISFVKTLGFVFYRSVYHSNKTYKQALKLYQEEILFLKSLKIPSHLEPVSHRCLH